MPGTHTALHNKKVAIIRSKEMQSLTFHTLQRIALEFMQTVGVYFAPLAAFMEWAELVVVVKDYWNRTRIANDLHGKMRHFALMDVWIQLGRTLARSLAVGFIMAIALASVSSAVVLGAPVMAVLAVGYSGIDYCYKGLRLLSLEKDNPERPHWQRLLFKGLMLLTSAAGLAVMFFCPPLALVGWTIAFSATAGVIGGNVLAHGTLGRGDKGSKFLGLSTFASIVIGALVITGVLAIPGVNLVVAASIVLAISVASMMYVMKRTADHNKLAAASHKIDNDANVNTDDMSAENSPKVKPTANLRLSSTSTFSFRGSMPWNSKPSSGHVKDDCAANDNDKKVTKSCLPKLKMFNLRK